MLIFVIVPLLNKKNHQRLSYKSANHYKLLLSLSSYLVSINVSFSSNFHQGLLSTTFFTCKRPSFIGIPTDGWSQCLTHLSFYVIIRVSVPVNCWSSVIFYGHVCAAKTIKNIIALLFISWILSTWQLPK